MTWGEQLKVSIYREGEFTDAEVERLRVAVNEAMPNAEFVGISMLEIAEHPMDQVAA